MRGSWTCTRTWRPKTTINPIRTTPYHTRRIECLVWRCPQLLTTITQNRRPKIANRRANTRQMLPNGPLGLVAFVLATGCRAAISLRDLRKRSIEMCGCSVEQPSQLGHEPSAFHHSELAIYDLRSTNKS